MCSFVFGETVKDREGAVRSDLKTMKDDARWIYNDIDRGFAEAKKTNKPLLVFTVDQAPAVSLTAPATGAVFPALSTINVAASVADVDGSVSKVEFFSRAPR